MFKRLKNLFPAKIGPLADRPLPQAEHYLREWGVRYKKKDGALEVYDLVIKGKGLKELPDLGCIVVRNLFDCSNNELTSLKGSPRRASYVVCSHNKLVTLEGAPREGCSNFTCSHNALESLEGAPRNIYYFNCHDNKLLSLKGAPEFVRSKMICTANPMDTLDGAPVHYTEIESDFGTYTSASKIPGKLSRAVEETQAWREEMEKKAQAPRRAPRGGFRL